MQENIFQLNRYLSQMLECLEPIEDGRRLSQLNREYTKLFSETFPENASYLGAHYNLMRNHIVHAFTYPELKGKVSEVREFLNQASAAD